MWKRFLVLPALLLLGYSPPSAQDQKPTAPPQQAENKIPPEAIKQPNPVKPTPESIAKGKRLYGIDCAMCHGKDGDGKGDLAGDMNLKLMDFHNPDALKDATDGEIFYVIKNGKGQMPAEGDRATHEEVWNLVNYIRSLAKKEGAEKEKAEPQ
jgi:mono/diheme cytochrome c family protein